MIRKIIEQTSLFITGAVSFIAALAWNDAIRTLLKIIDKPPYGVFTYAFVVTILAVAASIILGKIQYKYGSSSDPRKIIRKYSKTSFRNPAKSFFSRFSRK